MSLEITDKEEVFVYVVGWAGGIVCLVGLLGNTFTLLVLTKKDFRQSNSTLYLIALCLYDGIFLAINVMVVSFDWVAYGLDPYNDFNLKFTVPAGVILDPIGSVLVNASVYTTIALTIDRCIAVVKPLQWPSICTRGRIKIVIGCVFAWSTVYNIPFYMEFKYQDIFIKGLNESYLLSRETDYSRTFFHTEVFLEYMVPVVTMAIPIVTIIIPNLVIIVVLRRQHRNMESSRSSSSQSTSASSSRSNRLTAQVLFISGFTLLSRMFHSATYIVMDDVYYINKCSYACACVAAVSALVVNINAAINFVCYCLFGEKFRSAFVQTICACFGREITDKRGKRRSNSTTTTTTTKGSRRVTSTSGISSVTITCSTPKSDHQTSSSGQHFDLTKSTFQLV